MKTASLIDVVAFADVELNARHIQDYCPNGLQVEGAQTVRKMIGGVTASQALIDAAIQKEANLILVHHGFFWKGESPIVCGMKRNRLKALLENDISLLAYHLPLDLHPLLGNNVGLAKALGIEFDHYLDSETEPSLVSLGHLPDAMEAIKFSSLMEKTLGRQPLHIQGNDRPIKRVAWCTGAAQSYFDKAADAGVDAYISGEISEPTVHIARERGVHYFAAGHHATERFGVQSLGKFIASKFNIEFEFVDIFNPV
jgi:dinuclear metal center YbgI/SA1388 family protein